jgi:hypothetical protein
MIALQVLALIHGIFFILVVAWDAWSSCISGSISCDSTSILIYTIGFITDIILMLAAVIALFAIWTYAQAVWRRQYYVAADAVTYRSLTGDTANQSTQPTAPSSPVDQTPASTTTETNTEALAETNPPVSAQSFESASSPLAYTSVLTDRGKRSGVERKD